MDKPEDFPNCKYLNEGMSGLDCPCERCAKIRDMLFQKEIDGQIHIVADKKNKGKWRR